MGNTLIPSHRRSPIDAPASGGSLLKQNFLGEFESEEDKAKARLNLGVKSEAGLDEELDRIKALIDTVSEKIVKHLTNVNDPHKTILRLEELMGRTVMRDGSTAFTAPQKGVAPVIGSDLTTKEWVEQTIVQVFNELNKTSDSEVIRKVKALLSRYVEKGSTYSKEELYTKGEIEGAFDHVVHRDGGTPFVGPQPGVDPVASSHLATKRYVDKVLYDHVLKDDPHGIKQWILDILRGYPSKSDLAGINEVDVIRYSNNAISKRLEEIRDEIDPLGLLSKVDSVGYVKNDGSVPFTFPQKGVDAIDPSELVTKRQVDKSIEAIKRLIELTDKSIDRSSFWNTSGAVSASVGLVERGTEVKDKMSLQEIMDLIFYGKQVKIIVPKIAEPGGTTRVCVRIDGPRSSMKVLKLYQNEDLIWTGVPSDVSGNEICMESKPLKGSPVKWKVVIEYSNSVDEILEETKLLGLSIMGILPEFKQAASMTYMDFKERLTEDSINNKALGDDFSVTYTFDSYNDPMQIFLMIPSDVEQPKRMITSSQSFNINTDNFNLLFGTPMDVNGTFINYNIYVYREPIVRLSAEKVGFVID